MSPALQDGFLTIAPPGKSPTWLINVKKKREREERRSSATNNLYETQLSDKNRYRKICTDSKGLHYYPTSRLAAVKLQDSVVLGQIQR